MNQMPPTERSYVLHLYVAGRSSNGTAALRNLTRFCEVWLRGRYELRVVDVLKEPDLAAADGIVATPTLVRQAPEPSTRLFGVLDDELQLLSVLGAPVRPGARLGQVPQAAAVET